MEDLSVLILGLQQLWIFGKRNPSLETSQELELSNLCTRTNKFVFSVVLSMAVSLFAATLIKHLHVFGAIM